MQLPPQPADLYEYQRLAEQAGYSRVVGIDEAGRGPLAGPVVVAAVSFPATVEIDGVDDSKKLGAACRQKLYAFLVGQPYVHYAVSVVSVAEIDSLNILRATYSGMQRCAQAFVNADLFFVDGNPVGPLGAPTVNVVKGDAKCAVIAAASIIAKVHRDTLMTRLDRRYPGYGFGAHKGYGTQAHRQTLDRLGPCAAHRRSFAPVARCEYARREQWLDL